MDNSENSLLIQCLYFIIVVFLIVLIFIAVQNTKKYEVNKRNSRQQR